MTRRAFILRSVAAGIACMLPCALAAQSARPARSQPLTGTVKVCGSPQMRELLHHLEEGFHRQYSDVMFQEDLQSTLTAVSGVSGGSADIGLLGREIWPEEVDAFQAKRGQIPLVVPVATGAFDVPKATFALMVFVPKESPLRTVSITQLREIFTSSQPMVNGQQLHLYGFAKSNDKARIFASLAFHADDAWSPALHEFANDDDGEDAGAKIVQAVAADRNGIGISNVHYATGAVRALPISRKAGGIPVTPTRSHIASHLYPLTREVYLVMSRDATPATRAFVAFILSRGGQQSVSAQSDYLPLPEAEVRAQRKRLPPR